MAGAMHRTLGSMCQAVQRPRRPHTMSMPGARSLHHIRVTVLPTENHEHPAEPAAGSEKAEQLGSSVHDQPSHDSIVSLSDTTVEEPPGFSDLGVDAMLASSLSASGIEVPSPIQEAAIPQLLQGHNAAVQSYTGSGKTLAYLLPAMTLSLRRAEAAFAAQRAAAAAGRSLSEADMYSVQVLVVAPNQELAMQICRVAADLMPKEGRSAVQQAIGGANMRRQAEAIAEHQPLVVVGTPGRLADLVRLGALRLHRCPILILDEADQLLGDVFSADMRHIMEHCGKRLGISTSSQGSTPSPSANSSTGKSSSTTRQQLLKPSQRQTVLVSATLWDGILSRFNSWCPNPLFLTAGGSPTWVQDDDDESQGLADSQGLGAKTWGWGAKGWDGPASVVQQGPKTQGMAGGAQGSGLVPTLPPNLEHMYLVVNPQHKADAVRRAMYALNVGMGLAFMNWQQRLKDVAGKVAAKKIEVGLLHGELAPSERAAVLDAARKGAFQLLLVSDVAARGIDLPQVDVVFNIELPSSASHYAHRAGRTGRMGAPGLVVTLVAPGERFVVERLSKKLGVPILECHLARGELVVGPPPVKDTKKKISKTVTGEQHTQEDEQQQQQLTDRQNSNSQASSSISRSGISRQEASVDSGSSVADVVDESSDAESDDYIIDEDDDVDVEGDEPVDVYRARIQRDLQQELEELRQEKQASRQRRYKQQQGAAAAGGGPSQDQSLTDDRPLVRKRRTIGPKPPKGSPEEAAAMAMAAIAADEKARKGKSKLPAELVEVMEGSAGKSAGKSAAAVVAKRTRRSGGADGSSRQRRTETSGSRRRGSSTR